MLMAKAGDLRQVGYAQHLASFAKRPQFLSDHFRHGAADAGVDFVEHHGRCRIQTEGGHFNGQTDTGQLAAEATLRKARGGWPGLAETMNSQRSRPCACGVSSSLASRATANRPPAMPSSAINALTMSDNSSLACRRVLGCSVSAACCQGCPRPSIRGFSVRVYRRRRAGCSSSPSSSPDFSCRFSKRHPMLTR